MYGKGTADARRDGDPKRLTRPQITRDSAKETGVSPTEIGSHGDLRHGEMSKDHRNAVFKTTSMNYATEKGGCLFIDLAGATPVSSVGDSVYAITTEGDFSRFKVFLEMKNETTSAKEFRGRLHPLERGSRSAQFAQTMVGVPWSVPEQAGRARHQTRIHSA